MVDGRDLDGRGRWAGRVKDWMHDARWENNSTQGLESGEVMAHTEGGVGWVGTSVKHPETSAVS